MKKIARHLMPVGLDYLLTSLVSPRGLVPLGLVASLNSSFSTGSIGIIPHMNCSGCGKSAICLGWSLASLRCRYLE